ncbi:MAG: Flp pilus assembly protein CpaB [bacterium]|nr:Flp pilus assembly protein CpaB [bacterium]
MSRISPGTLLLAIVAVLFGLLGAYIVKQNLTEQSPVAGGASAQTVNVPRVGNDLKAGRQVALGDIVIEQMTYQQMREAGINEAFMGNTKQIIGRVLREDMKKGATFDITKFYPEGTGPNVADMLEPGQRAVTVPVEVRSAVAGFARPGTWVDLIFRSDAGDDAEARPETTITLLNKVRVLAFNEQTFEGAKDRSGNAGDKEASVTLAVDAFEAASLRIVDGRGTLSLALRHPDDIAGAVPANLAPRTLEELMKIPPPNKHQIEVYRGNNLSNVEFDKGDRTSPSSFVLANDRKGDDNQGSKGPPSR